MIVENCPYGSDPRVMREAKTLSAVGHTISVIGPAEAGRPWHEKVDGIAVYRFKSWKSGGRSLGYLVEYVLSAAAILVILHVVLVGRGFDVIHVANPPDILVPIVSIFRLLGKQIIYDQHDLSPELYATKFCNSTSSIYRFLLRMEVWSYRLSDYVITPNDSYKKIAMARGGVRESKITVVRNGPDGRFTRCNDYDVELRDRSPNILAYAGRIGSQDGLELLCDILSYLRNSLGREDFYCIIIGDGDDLQRIRLLTTRLHLEDKILFTGWIADSRRFHRLLSTADICLSPEPYNRYNNQSTFLKIMDFMSAAKPIVAFDLDETRFSAGEAAVYAPRDDIPGFARLLVKLMDDPVVRKKMGQHGQRLVREKLSWEHSVPKLLGLYNMCRIKNTFRRQSIRALKGLPAETAAAQRVLSAIEEHEHMPAERILAYQDVRGRR